MTAADWHPTASIENLRLRACVFNRIRAFFAARDVIEVETPILSRGANTDPNIHPFVLDTGSETRFLHTSPEHAMKRLLAAGYGDMFQIGKVFRQGEQGRYHNPEFTLLEWYRPHWDHWQLMDEVDGLLMDVLNGFIEPEASQHLSYRDAFRAHVGIDPFTSTLEDFECAADRLGMTVTPMSDNNGWLDFYMVHVIAPAFVKNRFTFVYDYPASQAALAAIRYDDPPVAERFEVFWGSLELANGYRELTDAVEQHQRFTSELAYRNAHGLVEVLPDGRLIDALASGFPPCSGVAVGVDRMLMLATGAQHIQEVLSFPWERA